MLRYPENYTGHRQTLSNLMARYAWPSVIDRYDHELEALIETGRRTVDAR
jgi:hypothetical protein